MTLLCPMSLLNHVLLPLELAPLTQMVVGALNGYILNGCGSDGLTGL